jgi:hypothetical protein
MDKKEHLIIEGICKIVNIRSSINNGLSENLIASFPNVLSIERPLVKIPDNINPNWFTGFVVGEGCFTVAISKSDTLKHGLRVQFQFKITQHSHDIELMKP